MKRKIRLCVSLVLCVLLGIYFLSFENNEPSIIFGRDSTENILIAICILCKVENIFVPILLRYLNAYLN